MSTPWLRTSIRWALPLAFWLTLLLIWEMAFRFHGWRAFVFPAPSHVLDALLSLLHVNTGFGEPLVRGWPMNVAAARAQDAGFFDLPLVQAVLVSLARLAVGFSIAIALGGLLGLLMWRYAWADGILGPVLLGLQTLPSVCWVPLAILTFGLNEKGILFVLVIGSFAGIAVSLRDGLRQIPPIYRRAGWMLGARKWTMYRYVMLPASLPALSSALRQGFSFAWRSLMGAELIFLAVRHRGVGYQLAMGREVSDVAQVVGVLLVMIAIGMIVDRLVFARIESQVYGRFGLNAT